MYANFPLYCNALAKDQLITKLTETFSLPQTKQVFDAFNLPCNNTAQKLLTFWLIQRIQYCMFLTMQVSFSPREGRLYKQRELPDASLKSLKK